MQELKQKFKEKAEELRPIVKEWSRKHGDVQVDTVSLSQVIGGMRGIKSMFWNCSNLDPEDGIRFRGHSIPELKKLLPTGRGKEPLPEGLFWLMLVGEIPTEKQVNDLADEWERRNKIPQYVFDIIDSLPLDMHPMTQFTIGINALQKESVFAQRYAEGISKNDYWDPTYEDTMNLIARLPRLASYLYRRIYHHNDQIEADLSLDWGANFAHMLGFEEEQTKDFMRLYMVIHADHEGGNASAHTTHLVGSTLSDAYYSLAAGMNALAGPLHGLANQEVIKFIFEMLEELGTDDPSLEQIKKFVNDTLDSGKVIPGYGHAVLRQPDPRFMAQKRFAEEYLSDSKIVSVVWKLFDVVPDALAALGKVKNPWPNVDAHSGAILVHYGLREFNFYTVLFGVSRALGVLSALCWSRALGLPLERPKSVTADWIEKHLNQHN